MSDIVNIDKISELRVSYKKAKLSIGDLNSNPIDQFKEWLQGPCQAPWLAAMGYSPLCDEDTIRKERQQCEEKSGGRRLQSDLALAHMCNMR